MSGEKHTPGPWRVIDANEGDGHPRPFWVVEGGETRAFYDPSDEFEDAPYLRAELHYGVHADAVLMAAAPKLLQELAEMVGWAEILHRQVPPAADDGDFFAAVTRTRALIAKVRGEAS